MVIAEKWGSATDEDEFSSIYLMAKSNYKHTDAETKIQNQGCFLLRGAEDQVIHVDGLEEPTWAPGILGRLADVKLHR